MPLVKFSTLAGGVFIEDDRDNITATRTGNERCFRFDKHGNAEYAYYSDLTGSNPAPRWYGSVLKERDFTFA
jgi:hypothetical protein